MGMLPSFILRSLVNDGSHLSNFHSFSSSSNTIATHIEALNNKPMYMPVRGKGKRDHRFDNVEDTLILFSKMIEKYPKPSVMEFNKLLGAIIKMKHYAIVVSKYRRIELLGVSHNVYSMSILINCFCQLGRIDFGLSVLGKMLKLGVEPSAVTFSTLRNGLYNQSNISEVVCMFDEITERGYQPDLIVYNIVLKGLFKTVNTDRVVRFLRLMEGRSYEPNIVLNFVVLGYGFTCLFN
ncbi:hypothetical protein J1N35_014510 [Gossypium stocksii]|uniref:Pentatricopeptide repeat-containing protein n=1 Tax=Gossypium stocksii TaxID=47602 RepID=A0A9D3VX55_9ROSI|nr:hypothetical protein J1N35_014510 [Gossypium stocksii]